MTRHKIVYVFIFLSLFSLSCQEDFNPKTDFKEQYVLNCYIDLDYDQYMNTQVYATVSKLYNVDGFDPSQNKIDPTIAGAEIYLTYRDKLYKLQQDTDKTVFTKYNTKVIYYDTSLQYIYPNYNVSISAKMPDGTMLTAQTQLLEALQLNCSYDFRNNFTTKINKFLWGNALTLSWANYGNRLFCPVMTIEYFIYLGGEGKSLKLQGGSKQIPITFANKNGQLEPIYPPNCTSNASISFDYAAIDSAMAQISLGDNDKKKYNIDRIYFQMVEMDAPLSNYYESLHGSSDNYSISLDETIYSNIKGGLGIFGCKRTISNNFGIDSSYANSFGYRTATQFYNEHQAGW